MLLWVFLDSLRVFVCYFAFSFPRLSKLSLLPLSAYVLIGGGHYVSGGTLDTSREVTRETHLRLRGYLEGGFPVTYWVAIRVAGEG